MVPGAVRSMRRSWFNAALAGGAIGLAVLCRPTFCRGWDSWPSRCCWCGAEIQGSEVRVRELYWLGDFGWRMANLAGLVIAAAAVMSPWAIRNCRVFGLPVITTTHGGYTLLLGNNKSFYGWLARDVTEEPWKVGDEPGLPLILRKIGTQDPEVRKFLPSETSTDSICYNEALKNIATSPARFAHACAYRVVQLWSPLPNKLTADESSGRRLLRYATCAWYCGVYVLTAVGIWRLRWRLLRPPWIWGVLLCLAFTAVHTFYSNTLNE